MSFVLPQHIYLTPGGSEQYRLFYFEGHQDLIAFGANFGNRGQGEWLRVMDAAKVLKCIDYVFWIDV